MRVLQVTTSARRRGAEVFADQLGEKLTERGHAVTTVALEASPGGSELGFPELGRRRSDPTVLRRLVSLSRTADVVLSHGGSTLGVVAACSRVARRPFVYRNIGDPSYWGGVRGARIRVGVPLRSAAHIVALYEGAARYMTTRYGLDHTRMTVSPNAVDADRFPLRDPATRAEARAQYGLDPDKAALGFLGNLSPEKRPEWALEVTEEIGGATLLVAGDGPLRDRLTVRAAELNARSGAPTCQLVGQLSDPAGFLSALDVLLLPSATEGIPGVLLEAALVGVPTVATDVGGVPDTVEAIRGGRCVAAEHLDGFTAAVRELLESPEDHVPDREAVIERHGIEAVADTWTSVLHRVAER